MRILFLSANVAPGQGGVADYTRSLAGEFRRMGHEVGLLGLNEFQIAQPEVLPLEKSIQELQLPATLPWCARRLQARQFVEQFQADWLSLQFVSYGFHPKGVVAGLHKKLEPIIKGQRLHCMMHELWIGEQREARFFEWLTGRVQKFCIGNFLRRTKPGVLQTSNETYVHILHRAGFAAERLPMFGNIPICSNNPDQWLEDQLRRSGLKSVFQNRGEFWLFGFFGTLHPVWTPEPLFQMLASAGRQFKKKIVLIAIGELGRGRQLWDQLSRQYGNTFSFLNLGRQTAENISQFFQQIDFGIATSPLSLIGKSGTAAAMLEHDLPLIVNREEERYVGIECPVEGRQPQIIRLQDNFSKRLAESMPRRPGSRLPAVVAQMIRSLEASTAGSQASP